MNVCVIYNVFIIFINNNEKSKQIFFFFPEKSETFWNKGMSSRVSLWEWVSILGPHGMFQ